MLIYWALLSWWSGLLPSSLKATHKPFFFCSVSPLHCFTALLPQSFLSHWIFFFFLTMLFPFSERKWTSGNPIFLSYIESTGPGSVPARETATTKTLIRLTNLWRDSENFIKLLPAPAERTFNAITSMTESDFGDERQVTDKLHPGNQTSHPNPTALFARTSMRSESRCILHTCWGRARAYYINNRFLNVQQCRRLSWMNNITCSNHLRDPGEKKDCFKCCRQT